MQKKVMFFLNSLSGGGAERTIINIIRNLNPKKYETILVLGTMDNNDYSHLVSDINIKVLNTSNTKDSILKLSKSIKKVNPDLLFSTLNGNNIVLILAKMLSFKGTPIIVREASNRTQSGSVKSRNRIITRLLYNYKTKKVIALSNGVKKDLIENFKVKEKKIKVIYNPIEVKQIQKLSNENINDFSKKNDEKLLISVGRLVDAKDFETLINAFSLVNKKINVRLLIVGKGPKEEELKKLSEKLNISNKIDFIGFKSNPYKYMKLADLFILSSKWEGFGHVIAESMAVGTPVISTDCNSGPREIIGDNKYGILVPVGKPKELAEKIIEVINGEDLNLKKINEGKKRSMDFNAINIINEYEEVFDEYL